MAKTKTAKRSSGKGSQRIEAIRGFLRARGIAPDASAKVIDVARADLHKQFGTSKWLGRPKFRAMIADALGKNGHNGNGNHNGQSH